MAIWTSEIKELEKLYESFKGLLPELEKELGKLIKADDENMILLYSRRSLEVIITDLCECELKRPRKTEPLKGIIDKLQKEEKVPSHIISSMHGLNELSTYGAHPKDFDPEQVKPVLNNLSTIIKWYLKNKEIGTYNKSNTVEEIRQEVKSTEDVKKGIQIPRKRLISFIIGSILLIVIVVSVLYFSNIIGGGKQTTQIDKSIAVLPFKNDSPDPENEYFCNGMMDDILNHLVKINDLDVKSRSDIEPYRETTKSLKEIGKELGVTNILEGSIRKQGNRFKISIQLILAESGFHLWSDTFEGEYSEEIFSIQSNIAQKVATALNAVISLEEKEKIERVPTTDIKAYEFCIRAQQLAQNYWRDGESRYLPEAHRLLDKALEIDPGYEKAIVAKGGVFLAQSKYDSVLLYANRLKDLNPSSANGYYMMGEYYNFTYIADSAIENYLLAIKLFTKNEISEKDWSEFALGSVYCLQKNDYQKGLIYLQRGWDIKQEDEWVNPYIVGNIFRSIGDYERSYKYLHMSLGIYESPQCIEAYIDDLIVQSRFEEALNFLDTICKEPQNKVVCNQKRFNIHLIRKEFDLAEQFYTNFLSAGGIPNVADSIWLSYLYRETGKEQAAITLLKRCQISQENNSGKNFSFFLPLHLSSIYALMDNKEEALKNLTKSVDNGLLGGWHDFLEICPFFQNLWDDPDFKAIVHRAQNEKAIIRSQVKKMEQSGEIDL